MKHLILALLLVTVQTPELTPEQEMEATALMREIRCVVCDGQAIADSEAALAQDMRTFVRNQIAAGAEPDSVRIAISQTYGDDVLLRPVVNAQTLPLYLAPLLFLLFGGFLILAASRSRRKN